MSALAFAFVAALAARTGTGDPAEIFRDKDPQSDLVLHGQLRLRSALYNNLELDRRLFKPDALFPQGLVLGNDARVRLTPSFFIGDDLRAFLDVDLVTASLGEPASGGPYTVHDPFQSSFLDVRAAGVDWLLPVGVLSIGRMPSHFALGIAANDGADLDDDNGDHADRVALVLPLYGHLLAAAFDVLDPNAHTPGSAPAVGEQAVTLGVMKWRAPWEIALYRDAGRAVFDYGLALSAEWSLKDAPGPWALIDQQLEPDVTVVRHDTHLFVADAWTRLVFGAVRLEAEGFVSDLGIDNPSAIPGVDVREPITGNPAAAALVADVRAFDDASADGAHALLELGAASADPAPGFPAADPTTAAGARPGDVFGPQVVFVRDMRFDAARMHPLHRVDLILWRTLLGGVSEAGYVRLNVAGSPLPWLRLEGNAIYSQAFAPGSAPGGVGPLGVEVDGAAVVSAPFAPGVSLRVDAGNLFPLGGLADLGGSPTSVSSWAQMVIVRLGYAL